VDGVAINGISGDPAFIPYTTEQPQVIGIVTAYIPNRVAGDTLPGVCFVAGIYPFYEFLKGIESIEQGQAKAIQEEANRVPFHQRETRPFPGHQKLKKINST
jgi:hypothetical protein